MSWLFSQALVEEYLGDTSLDGEPSVQSNGNPTQQAYCAPDKMTDFSRLSRFGMTYKPLTESRGEELLTLYLGAFPAKTSAQPVREQGLTENGQECGEKWPASFTKYDPDSCLWKTHQCSLLGDLELYSETWPQWGLMRNGECWEQQMSAHLTNETEFGLSGKWPIPDANCGMRGTQENWTPKRKSGHLAQYTINQAVRDAERIKWGTPKVQDSRHALRDRGKGNLGEQVSGLHNGGKLNPLWTEWLMGWWIGWTDLKPLEMDKFLCVPQPHGES